MLEIQFYVISALIIAATWALPAAGISLIYGVQRYPNFAIAEYATLGAYVTLALTVAGLGFLWAAIVAAIATGLIATAVDQTLFRRVRGAGPLPPILLSLGLMLVLQNVVRFIWGNDVQQYSVPMQSPWVFGGFIITPGQLGMIAVAGGLLVLLYLVMRRTPFGRDTRAVANNPDLALTSGVEPERVYAGVIFTAGALAALGGVLLGLASTLTPMMGWHILIPIFAVAILGGLGNVMGVLLAAVLLGLATEFSLYWIESSYKPAIAFLALVLVLSFRPGGILKGEY